MPDGDMDEPITVLHVDDDSAFLDLAATFLEREHESISVITTNDAREGLARIEDGDVDCVVSDLEMPTMDGLSFLESVSETHPDLPFILFTGKGSEEVASQAISAGVTDYLQKGTGTDQYVVLANRIQNAVGQKRAERALADSERRFRALIEHSQDIIMVLDTDGSVQYVSPTIEQVVGYQPDDMLGKNAFQYIHPDDRETAQTAFFDAVEDPSLTPRVECRLQGADGSWLIINAIGTNRLDDPAVEGFVVNVRDVTERKRTDDALSEAKNTIEALYDVAARMERCTDTDGVYQLAVDSAERILEFDLCIADEIEAGALVPTAISSGVTNQAYYDTTPIEQDDSLAAETFRERTSYSIGDLHEAGYAPAKATYQSAISIPVGDWGVFQAVSEKPYAFDDTDLDATELLVAHLIANIERIEREETLQTLHAELDRLRWSETVDEIATVAVEAARDVLDMPLCGVYFVNADGDALEPVASTSQVEEIYDGNPPTYTPEQGVVWEAFEAGEPRIVADVRLHDDRPSPETPTRSLAVFPLGERGVIIMASTTPDDFDSTDIHFAKLLAAGTESTLIRVHRERELEANEARLERERRQLTALFENATDCIAHVNFVDGEPIILDLNRAFEETFGIDTEAVVGQSVDDLIVPPGLTGEAAEITERGQRAEDFDVQVRRMAADGPRDFLLRSVPVEANGDTTSGYGVYTDITERAKREAELQRQNERLEEFASVVSHDLRNPLTVAQGYFDLVTETGDPAHYEKVADALGRMDRIIQDLLALAREGQTVEETDVVDVAEVARRGWRSVDSGDASFVVDGDVGEVAAHGGRLQGLFENLFRNAIEHGGESVTVHVGALPDGAGFFVEDDGAGLPPDRSDEVFEFGYSTDDDGTGFGLAIVRQIVEAHDWSIVAGESESGGARFEIRDVELVSE